MTGRDFSATYIPLKENFYRVAYYLLEDSQDAEDVVQDLYIKLWNSLDSLDAVRNPRAYGITILHNLCIDRIRRSEKMKGGEIKDAVSDAEEIDSALAAKENFERVTRAVSTLPDRQREVLLMKAVYDLSYEEIQERTGMSYVLLRVLLSQARSKLKKYYEKY